MFILEFQYFVYFNTKWVDVVPLLIPKWIVLCFQCRYYYNYVVYFITYIKNLWLCYQIKIVQYRAIENFKNSLKNNPPLPSFYKIFTIKWYLIVNRPFSSAPTLIFPDIAKSQGITIFIIWSFSMYISHC